MGLYATTTALQTLLYGVTFDTATTNLASLTCADAEAEVNKYLGRRYNIASSYFQTTTSIPPMCRTLATRLAEGYMWQRMSRGAKESITRGLKLEEGVLKNLADLRDYKVDLLDSSGAAIPEGSNPAYRVKSTTRTYVPTFAEDTTTSWRVDPEKLDDIADERG